MDVIDYRPVQDMRLRRADLDWADTVFLGRSDNPYERHIAEMIHDSGRRLIYILDDDLLNIPPNISSAAYLNQNEIQDNIRAMIEMSDAILSPSPILLQKYATNGRKSIWTEEPALEPVPYRPHAEDTPVKIGFAGSIDRTADLEAILQEALLRVKQKYGSQVKFEFFGAEPSFAQELNAVCVPYQESYIDYRRKLNILEWDIGLAPMPDTPFHACKHYNKFCEYAAAGIAGIYSDCPPYIFIPNRENFGRFCANDAQAWYEQLCAEIDDTSGREERRRLCSEYARNSLSPRVIASALYEAHPEMFSPCEARPVLLEILPLLKLRNVLYQIAEKTRRYGLKLPKRVWELLVSHFRTARATYGR